MFLTFVDDHHGDARMAVWCKAEPEEQKRLVASSPERFFVPPYVGVRGWVGVRLDHPETDWIGLAMLVEAGWVSVAPRRLASEPRSRGSAPRPPPPVVPKTDPEVARAALARLAAICLRLPGATQESEGRHATFRVGKKPFAYFLDDHHGDGAVVACVKVPASRVKAMVARDRKRFVLPAYIGPRGWLGVRVDAPRPDWNDITARVLESYRGAAPKRLLDALRPPARAASKRS